MSSDSKQSFVAITDNIKVVVQPWFIEQQTTNEAYIFGYKVKLYNLGQETVQLLERYWKIMDSTGEISHVNGKGVIGQQPLINPGKKYAYQSWSQLNSPLGTMEGYYQMRLANQEELRKISIPCFTLAMPGILN